ncbi:MAG: hypothetical protein A2252_04445 [Elusimicrobia bacterium RIFOXYA2_FULL_39_19]|nr:MAG: hypothetical protein A2252_04445 [Elusimicrobia bacterium RIFOXYA2_FULL_39_19]
MKNKLSYDVRKIKNITPKVLQAINFEYAGRKTEITAVNNEFSCVCPWSGLPDFAVITVKYVPDTKLIELKSLKLYLQSFRNVGIVHESVVNRILDDSVGCCKPLEMSVEALFNTRGGIVTTVKAEFKK